MAQELRVTTVTENCDTRSHRVYNVSLDGWKPPPKFHNQNEFKKINNNNYYYSIKNLVIFVIIKRTKPKPIIIILFDKKIVLRVIIFRETLYYQIYSFNDKIKYFFEYPFFSFNILKRIVNFFLIIICF